MTDLAALSTPVVCPTGPRIPVAGPWVTDLEVRYVSEAAATDWYGNAGRSVAMFEREFADHLGLRHGIAVPHGTSALHLAMLGLGIGPGDEVVVPEATWVASAAPIVYLGATPVFADIDPDTWCLDPDSLQRVIGPRTKAIVTVDLYGNTPDMNRIRRIAGDTPVIEDAAQAIGASRNGSPAGALGDIGVFSFHGTKTMTTGEGGMVVTDDDALHERMSRIRDHGRTPAGHKFFVTDEIGHKFRMSSLQAAFGRAQLARIDQLVDKKRQIFDWYEQRLSPIAGVTLNSCEPDAINTYWMVTAVVDRSRRLSSHRMMAILDDHQIDSRPFLPPLSSLPAFDGYQSAAEAARRNPVAYDIASRAINLPSALMLTEDQVEAVCTAFAAILDDGRDPS
ncbi:glutamine--scyllo-inositol aminotransferase [Gordonia sp. HNM0687]|uniref:Glutamine--scyllo-inositol aminotransferase n=1 Tax=Gordonia mangrovi TaxID=2665643 RepID=A0A6L7GK53_9ACTN|nr:DegT/DnrJ/EryC1/StrS family aminotransferase [Gordonia mangrovi]MXP20286.1 glutamine--scyllo-inositol aminotransferase [Gordonia mangrovi]UVF79112.1 DegT/DnrJ/EryC1/StrS family aminotransferase [Gordonia mangrovi]